MKNFFLYYNKNNHILSKELIYDADSSLYQSQAIDEPFFVLGLYLDGKKYNSTDLTPYEQAFALSDYNDLKNVQPNFFRDSHTPLIFQISNLTASNNVNDFTTIYNKFLQLTPVYSLDSKYCVGEKIIFTFDAPTMSVAIGVSTYDDTLLSVSTGEVTYNVFTYKVADFNFMVFGDPSALTKKIHFVYFPETNCFYLDFNVLKLEVTYHVNPKGLPYVTFVDSDASSKFLIFYGNHLIDYADTQ